MPDVLASLPFPSPPSFDRSRPPQASSGGGGDDGTETRGTPGTDVLDRTEKPRMYKVLFHNDDYTTMEFVLEVLMSVFRRSRVEATRIMLTVHQGGKGIAGVYTREIAETKATTAMDRARAAGFPLLVTTEPE
jgi:ATP-dependent Clp protease adaptor protein ClpS